MLMPVQQRMILTDDHRAMLDELADENKLTRSDVIRALIETAHSRASVIYRKAGRWVVTDG